MYRYSFEAGWQFPQNAFPSVKMYSTKKAAWKAAYQKMNELKEAGILPSYANPNVYAVKNC